ncbi:glycerol-3-phosphate cytidylyltransferase [Rhizobium sp. AC44/96]|jgi:glycerol-3-phosphate cytidylyltransferase|uniref:adenylyltransferase/cytidyltransferase family protein n=1 Tax=Rhizobium sp. AC44/96 TaxID=1841654 RepID=UPI00081001D7|nr:adenylyltransferase/cytidyltransferase family protein [Rhizobium sp. AC44/96]OCJ04170.1 glycerol-3-phosphate cytidylyltransferase [Rhizobium sp. AC44/96]
MRKVITFGTFDVLHIGHIRILQRAKALGDHLTVGISTDALNYAKKQKDAVYSETDRMEIVRSIVGVDDVFLEHSLELKGHYIQQYGADILVMGDDWAGRFDHFKSLCQVVYLPRTDGISTTSTLENIRLRA